MAIPQQQQRLPEYDKLRQQAQQRIKAQGQEQGDALQRRFASLGNLKSGAALKQQEKMNVNLGQIQEEAVGAIDAQEAGEMQRRKEVQDQRDFASNEARLGRDFSLAEADKGRSFAALEAGKGREFAAGESALSRRLQSEQFDKSYGLQDRTFKEQLSQNKFMNKLALDEASMNKMNTNYNLALSLGSADPKTRAAIDAAWRAIDPTNANKIVGAAKTTESNDITDRLAGVSARDGVAVRGTVQGMMNAGNYQAARDYLKSRGY